MGKKYTYDYPMPSVTVDLVIFRVFNGNLEVLLIQRKHPPYKDFFALPGGYVEQDEDLQDAAARELMEETNLKDVYLEQLYTFGAPDRDPRGRVISVAYFALITSDKEIKAGDDAASASWIKVEVAECGKDVLAFDHGNIFRMALERLRNKIWYTPIAFKLVPNKFTIAQLKVVYEAILGEKLDWPNFRKRLMNRGLLKEASGVAVGTGKKAHRPARLYMLAKKG